MSRWVWFCACALLGLGMLLCGWLVPMHLRAVDASVLQKAARKTPSLVDQAVTLVNDKNLGAAQLLCQVAEKLPNQDKVGQIITTAARLHPRWPVWGGGDYHLEVLFDSDPGLPKSGVEPFTDWTVRAGNRMTVLELLRSSQRPVVQELLRCRSLTQTAIFSPSQSASGQALDTALAVCGLLLEERKLTPSLSNAIYALAFQANQGSTSRPLELVLLDILSLGQRFNWGQLASFVSQVPDAETLRLLADQVRKPDNQLPVLFAAVQLSGQ
ncbi:MAG TPA: hypothetical protein VNZ22_17740, partial [Bacillota bacterium]|nr:hypothetical protein [Bacillota bacterium]